MWPPIARRLGLCGLAACLVGSLDPISALPLDHQVVLRPHDASEGPETAHVRTTGFDVLEHLSAISPYFELDDASAAPPDGCTVKSAAYIVRHSNIYANDEEWPDIERFIEKLAAFAPTHARPPLDMLPSWRNPVTNASSQMEMLTEPGARDAEALGRSFARLYPHLKPHGTEPFLIWAADTPRDVGTAQAFLRGALPEHDRQGDGEGDGHVRLIKVPKREPNWKESLTPHKACPRFSKSLGTSERDSFKQVYATPIARRFDAYMPGFEFTPDDVYALQQMCGYETAIRGTKSSLCSAFRDDDMLAFEYAEDLRYHYMIGYGARYSPYLGMPFLRTAAARLLNTSIETHSTVDRSGHLPPNDTSTGQRLWVWFSHREEPPLIATSLGLFNNSDLRPDLTINETMPTDRIPLARLWRTSNMVPFLGHIALERLTCGEESFVRVIVNSTPIPLPTCHGGPGDSCPVEDFKAYLREREEVYGDFESACGITESHGVATL